MLVLKKEFMYVSKPFGGEEGGEGSQHAHCAFLKTVLCGHYVPTTCARTMPVHRLHIVCTNAPRALHGPTFSGPPKWAEMLTSPLHSRGPQQRGHNQSTKKNNEKT